MKRSAVLAAATVAALGGIHCGGSVEPSTKSIPDAAGDVIAPGTDYGIPVIEDTGAPEPREAGTFPDAAGAVDSATRDAYTEDVFAPGADYGIPPPHPEPGP